MIKILNKNKKVILAFMLGIMMSGITVYATTTYLATNIAYTTSKNENVKNVNDALNDLYDKKISSKYTLIPQKNNFVFDGWYDENNNLVNSNENVAHTLYSKWKWIEDCSIINQVITFDYTDKIDSLKLNCSGNYKLEVWGAQGGYAYSPSFAGGKGGYAAGEIYLNESTIVYIGVGGAGKNGLAKNIDYDGGYNGGGKSFHWINNNVYSASGGGATHIAYVDGILSDIGYEQATENNKLLIVAGGGGGGYYATSSENAIGGAGGGLEGIAGGVNNTSYGNGKNGLGGTQTSGGKPGNGGGKSGSTGSFGQGGDSSLTVTNSGGSGGGSGFFGGAGSTVAGAGGGSSYIEILNNSLTIDGNHSMPTFDGNNTMIGNSGDGYAKITYLGK